MEFYSPYLTNQSTVLFTRMSMKIYGGVAAWISLCGEGLDG